MKAILATINDEILAIDDLVPNQFFKKFDICKNIIRKDWAQFKFDTILSDVVMGYNTWKTLNEKPLPDRSHHYIITNSHLSENSENITFLTLEDFKNRLHEINKGRNVVLIGGRQIYEELLPFCNMVTQCNYEIDKRRLKKMIFSDRNEHNITKMKRIDKFEDLFLGEYIKNFNTVEDNVSYELKIYLNRNDIKN